MYKAGSLLRRSSIRLKSLSGGHSHLQIIIHQLREVRSTFKSFVTAQATLSEDMVKWSSAIENDAIHGTFLNLAELNSLWTEVQKDFVDSLKQFRYGFDLILEGERHVDQAKQTFSTREETEKNIRRELQKAYNKAPCEEIQLLRERLNRSEKAKELARQDVVDRVRENEAVRMIRLREGIAKFGSSFAEMGHKASIIFDTQQKLASEIPDVQDKAIQKTKYRGNASVRYMEETKEQLRCYRASSKRRDSYHDPPPPYTPSREKLNDLSHDFSGASLNDDSNPRSDDSFQLPSAPRQSLDSLSSPTSPNSVYPRLRSSGGAASVAGATVRGVEWRSPSFESSGTENGAVSGSPSPDYKPKRSFLFRTSTRSKSAETKRTSNHVTSTPSATPSSTPPNISNCVSIPPSPSNSGSPTNEIRPDFSTPPPYNPFYEWSQFPKKDE